MIRTEEITEKIQNCKNCRHSHPLNGPDEGILICENKTTSEGTWCMVAPAACCPNFDNHGHTPADIAAALADGARLIELTQDKFAIVDADDYDRLCKYKWHAVKHERLCYAKTSPPSGLLPMHRLVLNAPPHLIVDHINHNGLDNRKANLRLCTVAQNSFNRRPNAQPNKTSKYKGVSLEKKTNLFRAFIHRNKKQYYLGSFKNEIDAAKAYDKKALELFGEFAYLNFPEECAQTAQNFPALRQFGEFAYLNFPSENSDVQRNKGKRTPNIEHSTPNVECGIPTCRDGVLSNLFRLLTNRPIYWPVDESPVSADVYIEPSRCREHKADKIIGVNLCESVSKDFSFLSVLRGKKDIKIVNRN